MLVWKFTTTTQREYQIYPKAIIHDEESGVDSHQKMRDENIWWLI